MGEITSALAKLLPVIAGKLISPVPVAVMVLLLFTSRGGVNGLGYLLGWFLATLGLGVIILISGASIKPWHHAWFKKGSDILYLCFGVLFLFLALRNINKLRQGQGSIADTPKWLGRIEQFTFWKAMVLGIGLGTLGAPKNTTLVLQALIEIMHTNLGIGKQVLVFSIFSVLGSLGILALYIAYVLFGQKSRHFLEKLKDWLLKHDNVILLVLFIFLGGYFLARGGKALLFH